MAGSKPRVAIVGVGYSKVGRKTGQTSRQMTVQCVKNALEDSGLSAADVDGYTTVGGEALGDAQMLGMQPLGWFGSTLIGPAYSYGAVSAISAIENGHCHTAVTTRIISQQPTGQALLEFNAVGGQSGVPGDPEFLAPYGAGSPTQWAGLLTRRRMMEHGTTEEHFARHCVTQREHAMLNPDAIFRDPLTVDDYFNARYVSKPVRLLDCDYPVDSGSCIIYTTEERARDLKQKPVFVEASALSSIADLRFEMLPDMIHTSPHHCAELLWSRTDLRPSDVDCAQLYDGFTFITFEWLEALGLCPEGEAGNFVAAGETKLSGSMPTNTDGGACNVGRRHGANFCIEATRQLRGECGDRQVEGAEVAVWANAVGVFSGAVLMTSS
jgi:acetyl-CoA acetyltransferase